jgi:hypothetical protein
MMCVGLDVHAKWTTVVAVDPETGEMRRCDRVPNEAEAFGRTLGELEGPLHGVMEAGWNSWAVYDLLKPLFARLLVAAEFHAILIGSPGRTRTRTPKWAAVLLPRRHVLPDPWSTPLGGARQFASGRVHNRSSVHGGLATCLARAHVPGDCDGAAPACDMRDGRLFPVSAGCWRSGTTPSRQRSSARCAGPCT